MTDQADLPKCVVCGAQRESAQSGTWFFVGGPSLCVHVCSRRCLSQLSLRQLSERLADERRAIARYVKTPTPNHD